MDDLECLQPILDSYGVFKPLRTIVPYSVHLAATLALEIAAVVLASCHPNKQYRCREYFILLYAHVGLWFLTLIVDQIARVKHYNLRINGYLEFYKKTQTHYKLPIYILSLWNAAILLIQCLMQQFYPDDFSERCIRGGLLSPLTYVATLITIEFCIIAMVTVTYIARVRKFNKQKPPPDVQREEWNACSSAENFTRGEIPIMQLRDKWFDFTEKQADLIRHLKHHNDRLGEKLMVVMAQLHARNRVAVSN